MTMAERSIGYAQARRLNSHTSTSGVVVGLALRLEPLQPPSLQAASAAPLDRGQELAVRDLRALGVPVVLLVAEQAAARVLQDGEAGEVERRLGRVRVVDAVGH